jgi:hypothetical protein
MYKRWKNSTAALAVLSLILLPTCAYNSADKQVDESKVSLREIAFKRAVFTSFDHNADGVVLLSEAAHGIRSHAEASSRVMIPDINLQTQRECSRVASFSDEVSYVLDCAAEYARERLRGGDKDRPFSIAEAMHRFSGGVENLDPPFGLCEDLVDSSKLPHGILSKSSFYKHLPRSHLCRTLRNLGFCFLTCPDAKPNDDLSPRGLTATARAVASDAENTIPVLVSSDWHTEVWYDISNNQGLNAGGDFRGGVGACTCCEARVSTPLQKLTNTFSPVSLSQCRGMMRLSNLTRGLAEPMPPRRHLHPAR